MTRAVGVLEIVRQLKSFSARRINQVRHSPGAVVWQRSYWDHIIRTQDSAQKIWEYIAANPQMWLEGKDDGSSNI